MHSSQKAVRIGRRQRRRQNLLTALFVLYGLALAVAVVAYLVDFAVSL